MDRSESCHSSVVQYLRFGVATSSRPFVATRTFHPSSTSQEEELSPYPSEDVSWSGPLRLHPEDPGVKKTDSFNRLITDEWRKPSYDGEVFPT